MAESSNQPESGSGHAQPPVSQPDSSSTGLTSTQKFILAVFGAMVVASVLSVIGLTVLNSQQHDTGSATPNSKCVRLTVGATPSPGSGSTAGYSQQYVESDYFGCQTVGMNEAAAINLLKEHNIMVRISSRDGISFPLTADYSEARVNLSVVHSVVTAYQVG